ncbi:hypothetical protein [Epizootic haematopoietic necrosis virus]|uniref:Uncharacterized protein n=1 Tax=Epizootic haematopoietic necrosis virus TaxID=100217 RepID=D3TTX1_9VIRU|nr:hypothetical protein ATL82_gp088 [Epizootic haematopoietic necrosis virus]ACO25278.1 hypothetical protein [Epizootic haematopoietic necrosis virus]QNN79833.1 hypothetical protein [Epizootic haematopoietic necrosis virus]QNN79933.1 hypothetical protein [Epizootic haematopoietic necrosis virus]QNN80033.1 hypothetical protein [Epizootic haematopoietic necrosis virus]QNN80133.1 hypothetical protein [Epizootic haematopoietic necrosis virus]
MLQNYAIVLGMAVAVAIWYFFKMEEEKAPPGPNPPKPDPPKPDPPKVHMHKKKPHWMDPHLTGSQTVQYSRNRSMGDPIRGDLPIVPRDDGWFSTAANPAHTLHAGALSMIAPASTGGGLTVNKLISAYADKGKAMSGRHNAPSYYGSS